MGILGIFFALTWYGLALVSAGFALYHFVRWLFSGRERRRAILALCFLLFALSPYLFGFSLVAVAELRCRSAGIEVNGPLVANTDGIYWLSHVPSDRGASKAPQSLRSDGARELFVDLMRALVERRIAYVEMPYAKRSWFQGESEAKNQRLSFALSDEPGVDCLVSRDGRPMQGALQRVQHRLPPGTCIAWRSVVGTSARYELTTALMSNDFPGYARLVDHHSGEVVAQAKYYRYRLPRSGYAQRHPGTLFATSCVVETTDSIFAEHLASLTFRDNDVVPGRTELIARSEGEWSTPAPAGTSAVRRAED